MTQLYLNDQLVELPQGFQFATTLSRLGFGDITGRSITFTNSVKLKWTPTLEKLMGFIKTDKSGSSFPYAKWPAKVIQDGVDLIPEGIAWVTKVDGGVSLAVYENLITLFDEIAGKKTNQLYYLTPSSWQIAGIDAARLNSTGVKALVVSWGKPGALYQSDYFLPCFFYGEMVQKILSQTGLTLSGAILTDSRLIDLLIPYFKSRWEYPQGVLAALNQSITRTTVHNLGTLPTDSAYAGGATLLLPLTDYLDPVTTPSNTWTLNPAEWTAPNIGSPDGVDYSKVHFQLDINYDITYNGATFGNFRFDLWRRRAGIETIVLVAGVIESNPGGPITLPGQVASAGATDIAIQNGDQFFLKFYGSSDTPGETVDVIINTATLKVYTDLTVNRTLVNWNFLLADDVLQTTLIEDFFGRFGIIPRQVGGTLYLKTIEEISKDIAGAVDWSNKRISKEGDDLISFKALDYAQRNTFNYTNQEDDETLGQGVLTILNENLQAQTDIFNSEISNTRTSTIDGGKKAVIPVYDAASTGIDTFASPPGLRLVTQRAKQAGESAITFNATPRSDYMVGYFVDSALAKDTGMQYFLDQFYPSFKAALQKAKTITREYDLDNLDIASFDPQRMIFDNGGYYLVLKINSFVPGIKTKVDLLKLI